jgi:hypothetical protein
MTLRLGWHEQQWQRWWRSGGGGGGGGSDARVAAIAEQAGPAGEGCHSHCITCGFCAQMLPAFTQWRSFALPGVCCLRRACRPPPLPPVLLVQVRWSSTYGR